MSMTWSPRENKIWPDPAGSGTGLYRIVHLNPLPKVARLFNELQVGRLGLVLVLLASGRKSYHQAVSVGVVNHCPAGAGRYTNVPRTCMEGVVQKPVNGSLEQLAVRDILRLPEPEIDHMDEWIRHYWVFFNV